MAQPHSPPPLDWWPGPADHELARCADPAGRALVRDVRNQLVEWRLLADRTSDDRAAALYRGWHLLLRQHAPNDHGRCAGCPRRRRWPCEVLRLIHTAVRPP